MDGTLRRVRVDGHSVAYNDSGEGPPLVLLHGFTQDSRAWRPQLEALSDEYRVVAWDAPGAGASSDPPDTFGIADWGEVLVGFLDALSLDPVHVCGLSWGGLLADTYAGWAGSLPPPDSRTAAPRLPGRFGPAASGVRPTLSARHVLPGSAACRT